MSASNRTELERLDPTPTEIVLSTGHKVEVVPIRFRQFLAFLKIITTGGIHALGSIELNSDMSDEEFAAKMVALLVFSIPEADDEAVGFMRSIIRPVPTGDRGKDAELEQELDAVMYNPDLDDVVSIVEVMARNEASDIKALGKRLRSLMSLATKTGQVPTEDESSKSTKKTKTLSVASAKL